MIKGDFHLHTDASPDGGLSPEHIAHAISSDMLQVVAITDHDVIHPDTFDLATDYPGRVFAGEEITTEHEGEQVEIIGFPLERPIPKGLPTVTAAHRVKEQGGLVYIPHALEPWRKGAKAPLIVLLHELVGIDVMETYNGRSWQRLYGLAAGGWAETREEPIATANGSDAHGPSGWGRTYTEMTDFPTRNTFTSVLHPTEAGRNRVGPLGRLHPKANVAGKKLGIRALQAAYH